ncbi:MAG TPA: hypothetical protein VIN04_12760 [Myxococcota bacterium]
MTPRTPVLLVSCTCCRRLHVPLRRDVAHPLCSACATRFAAPQRGRAGFRIRANGLPG